MPLNSFFLPTVALMTVSLLAGAWFVLVRGSRATIAHIALASGLSLSLLCVFVYGIYEWAPFKPMYGTWTPVLLAFTLFSLVFSLHLVRHRPPVLSTLIALALALPAWAFAGMILGLLIACASGDCI